VTSLHSHDETERSSCNAGRPFGEAQTSFIFILTTPPQYWRLKYHLQDLIDFLQRFIIPEARGFKERKSLVFIHLSKAS
jgi:hypothetical protein